MKLKLPNSFTILENEEWQSYGTGILAGSSQPGYSKSNYQDKKLLDALKSGKTPVEAGVDKVLLDNLQGLHDSGIRTIYSLAHVDVDRNPELLKIIWEKHFEGTSYITNIKGIDLEIQDFTPPSQEQLKVISQDVLERKTKGENIVVHCGAGKGRTATVLTAIQMKVFQEFDVQQSMDFIEGEYGSRAETEQQKLALEAFSSHLQELEIEKAITNVINSTITSDELSKAFAAANNLGLEDKAGELLEKGAVIKNALSFATNKGKENILKYTIERGMIKNTVECIEAGANVNTMDSRGTSLFGIATAANNIELIDTICKSKDLDINLKDKNGKSPFMYAIESHNYDLMRSFIARGAKLEDLHRDDEINNNLKLCWKEAILQGNFKILKNLYEFDPELVKEKINEQSSLEYARSQGNKNMFICMVTYGIFDQKLDNSGLSLENDKSTVNQYLQDIDVKNLGFLISSGVSLKDLKQQFPQGAYDTFYDTKNIKTYLINAINENNLEALKNIDPDIVNKIKISSFWSPLEYAIDKSPKMAIEMCRMGYKNSAYKEEGVINNLLSLSIDLNMIEQFSACLVVADPNNKSKNDPPLIKAIKKQNSKMVNLLIDYKFPINQRDKWGKTPLMHAVEIGNSAILDQILGHSDLVIDDQDLQGKTALIYAVEATSPSAIKKLISKGANVDLSSLSGNTALKEAVKSDKPGMAEVLINECKANPNLTNTENKETPLMLSSSEKMTRKLIDLGASINDQTSDGNTALHIAINEDRVDVAKTLIELGAGVNITNNIGQTALMLAASKGNTKLFEDLLSRQADINAKTLDCAFNSSSYEIIIMILDKKKLDIEIDTKGEGYLKQALEQYNKFKTDGAKPNEKLKDQAAKVISSLIKLGVGEQNLEQADKDTLRSILPESQIHMLGYNTKFKSQMNAVINELKSVNGMKKENSSQKNQIKEPNTLGVPQGKPIRKGKFI